MGVEIWGLGFGGYLHPLVLKHQVDHLLHLLRVHGFRVEGLGSSVNG